MMKKSIDADNARKVRPTVYLFFLSWAQRKEADGELDHLLAGKPWQFEPDDRAPVLSRLKKLFAFLKGDGLAENAKAFRKTVKDNLLSMARSAKYKKVGFHDLLFI